MSSFPAAAASIKGVSQSLFLLTISSSWPCSIRNSCFVVSEQFSYVIATTYGNLREAISRSEMQAGVAFVFEIWVAQLVRVVANDALH
jgi:hypothetical protein